ncbi:MAG: Transcriptional activator protein ExaE [candidate division BRC1 bacterium ADurb.BinA364]|nr:MAG: Transcriptional activator protein ExaE [candidate division BRC1 bacterium ADurb.BinA364]
MPFQEPQRILIVDDHPIMRKGVALIIAQESDLEVCGEAETAAEALSAIEALEPQLVIVDISLQRSNGIDLIKDIRSRQRNLAVLAFSMHDESFYAERALRAGACGYVMKKEPAHTVIEAIRKALQGKIHVSSHIAERILHSLPGAPSKEAIASVDLLSDRELEVFSLIGQGRKPRQIAEEMHLSVKTVETYLSRIKEKLKLEKANDVLQHAIRWIQAQNLV